MSYYRIYSFWNLYPNLSLLLILTAYKPKFQIISRNLFYSHSSHRTLYNVFLMLFRVLSTHFGFLCPYFLLPIFFCTQFVLTITHSTNSYAIRQTEIYPLLAYTFVLIIANYCILILNTQECTDYSVIAKQYNLFHFLRAINSLSISSTVISVWKTNFLLYPAINNFLACDWNSSNFLSYSKLLYIPELHLPQSDNNQ